MLRRDLHQKAQQFRKAATPEDKLRVADAGRRERNWILGKPGQASNLAFLDAWFAKEVGKPHAELADLAGLWLAHAPKEFHTASLLSFKRGTLEMSIPSSAEKYKLEMALRTGLEQRLRVAHKGDTLKKIKVSLASAAPRVMANAQRAETEALRQTKLSEVLKAADKGDL